MVNLDTMTDAELEAFIDSPRKFKDITTFAETLMPNHRELRRYSFRRVAEKLLKLAWIRRYHWTNSRADYKWKVRYVQIYNSLPRQAQYPHASS